MLLVNLFGTPSAGKSTGSAYIYLVGLNLKESMRN